MAVNKMEVKKNKANGAKKVVKCKRCKSLFEARVADLKRGWGKYCSKSCKAVVQEANTGQYANHLYGGKRYKKVKVSVNAIGVFGAAFDCDGNSV